MHAEYTFITIRNRFQAGVTKFNHAYILPEAFKGAFKAIRMHSTENAFIFLSLQYQGICGENLWVYLYRKFLHFGNPGLNFTLDSLKYNWIPPLHYNWIDWSKFYSQYFPKPQFKDFRWIF